MYAFNKKSKFSRKNKSDKIQKSHKSEEDQNLESWNQRFIIKYWIASKLNEKTSWNERHLQWHKF